MNSFVLPLNQLLQRDLAVLEKEIASYSDPAQLWTVKGEIRNSAGNLCLHLCGNLQHFIGAVLGNSGYVRDRENEFSAKGLAVQRLIDEIARTKESLTRTFPKIKDEDLGKDYPIQVFGAPMTTQYFLMHLAGHLNYHLGQINYHRRLVASV